MATPQATIKDLVKVIHDAVDKFNSAIPEIQKTISAEIELLVKDLEIKDGKILPSAKNIRTIGAIKAKIESIIVNPKWKKKLGDFKGSFDEVTKLQNTYFTQIAAGKFKNTSVLKELRKQSVDATMESLSKAGISQAVAKPIQDILRVNITSGARYSDLTKQLRDFITTNGTGAGKLERYVKQITTDSLNQYSRNYTKVVTDDLGLDWFMYTGAEIETSRPFCQAMLEKKYFHRDEIPKLLEGDFPEFEKNEGEINPSTDLPYGMVKGTTVENFITYAGGYNCGHSIVPVHESVVPENVKRKFEGKEPEPASFKDRLHDDYPVKLNENIFKGIPDDTKFVRTKGDNNSWYQPNTKELSIEDSGRFDRSPWFQEHLPYHEGGHATHFENDIITFDHVDEKFQEAFDAARKSIKEDASVIEIKLIKRQFKAIDEKDWDESEKLSAAQDMLGALTYGKHGEGHPVWYYNDRNKGEMEAFAHGSALYHGESPVIKELMPEVHEVFRKYFEELYSNL